MRRFLSVLAALSACISAAAALPHPSVLPRADGHGKPRYSVVPLEPGDGAPGQESHVSSGPVTKTVFKTESPVTRVIVKTENPVTRVIVETGSPVTRVVVKTAEPQTVTKSVPLPAAESLPAASHGATIIVSVCPGASSSSAAGPATTPPAPTPPPGAAPSSPACEEATLFASSLASRDGPLIDVPPPTSVLVMAPTTLSTAVSTPQPWLPSPPPSPSSAVPDWDSQVPTAYPAWNGTGAYRNRRS
ncbi:hypothetical protein HRG_002628 [Hirsutella rhossiliensis]|uniref:Uncharacterized protein n=1 Tax=Hirsutella rhossiliensis TaxID=111463 RepID=A0A9P8SMD3_9HYPO|nr:uncharacterized protein HRG_02628 [Hirsutella rhossiliensis]KAH0967219.1 hypothetical protein HRG_02628 [Hirsutella rhossiliensis]